MLFGPITLIPLIVLSAIHLPIASYPHAITTLVGLLAALATILLGSILLSWRESRLRQPKRWLSRWYGLALVYVLQLCTVSLAVTVAHRVVKPFYVVSESMAPTLLPNDKIVGDMRWRGPPARGAIVLVKDRAGAVRIMRTIGLAGDRIAVRGRLPIVDGRPAGRSHHGSVARGDGPAAIWAENLPDGGAAYLVTDSNVSRWFSTQERTVPARHVFVLADNRDRGADSRFAVEAGGLDMVPEDALVGKPLYIYWSRDHSRIGNRLDQ